jgi:hypothetical protein
VSTLSRGRARGVERFGRFDLAVSRVDEGRTVGVYVFASVLGKLLRRLRRLFRTNLKVLVEVLE